MPTPGRELQGAGSGAHNYSRTNRCRTGSQPKASAKHRFARSKQPTATYWMRVISSAAGEVLMPASANRRSIRWRRERLEGGVVGAAEFVPLKAID